MATPFHPVGEKGIEPDGGLDFDTLTDEALALLDRALEVASDPAALFLAQQQKATALFQAGRHAGGCSASRAACAPSGRGRPDDAPGLGIPKDRPR